MEHENKRLLDENKFLTKINEEFGKENDDLRESLDRYTNFTMLKSFNKEKQNNDRPLKRQKTLESKGKKPVCDQEDDDEPFEPQIDEQDDKGARVCFVHELFGN